MIQEEVQKYIVRDADGKINPVKSARMAVRRGLGRQGAKIIFAESMRMINDGEEVSIGEQEVVKTNMRQGYGPPVRDPDTGHMGQSMSKARSRVFKDPHRNDLMDAGKYLNKEMIPMHDADFSSTPLQVRAKNPVAMDGGTMESVPKVQHGPYPITPETGERVDFKEGSPVTIQNPYSMQGSSRAPTPPPIAAPEMSQSIQEMISTADPSVLIPLPPEVSRGQTLGADAYSQMPPPQDLSGETLEAPPWPLVPPPVQPLPPPEQPAPPKPEALAPQFNMQNNLQPREQGIMEDYDRTDPSVLETPMPQPEQKSAWEMGPMNVDLPAVDPTRDSRIPYQPVYTDGLIGQPLQDQGPKSSMRQSLSFPQKPAAFAEYGEEIADKDVNIDVPGSFAEMQQQLLDEPLPQQQPYGLIGQPLQTNESPPLISTPPKGADSYNMEKNIPSAPYNMTEGLFNITEGLEPTPEEFHARAMKRSQARNDNIDFHAKAKQRALQKALGVPEVKQGVSKEKLAELNAKLKGSTPRSTVGPDGRSGLKQDSDRLGTGKATAAGKRKGVGSKTMADIKKDGAAEIKKTDTPKEAGKKITEDVISQMAGVGGDKWEGFIPALDNAIKELQRVAAGEDPYDIARARIARSSRRALAGTEYSAKSEAAQAVRNKASKSLKGGLDAAVATGKEVGRVTDKRAAKEEGASVKLFNSMTSSNFLNWLEDPQNRTKMDKNKLVGVAAQARLRALQAAIAKDNSEKAKAEKEKLEKAKKLLNKNKAKKKKSKIKAAKADAKKKAKAAEQSTIGQGAEAKKSRFTRNFDKAMAEVTDPRYTPRASGWPEAKAALQKRMAELQRDYENARHYPINKNDKVKAEKQINEFFEGLDKRAGMIIDELRAWKGKE